MTTTQGGQQEMADGNLVRLGGIFGLVSVVAMIPAYLVGYPDAPGSPEEAGSYFEEGLGTFVFFNGVLPLFHTFFFILFLGVLYGMLGGAQEDGDRGAGGGVRGALPAAALGGGILFAAVEATGFTAEILFPAALQRFGVFEPDAAFVLVSLTLASWLYHFCQIGASAMVLATSLVALETGVLPRWLALGGFVITLLTFLHVLLPLVGALVGLLWIAAVSMLMVTGGVGGATGGPRRRPVPR
jgi:hypothetical protein